MSTELPVVTLYSLPDCVQCNTTKMALKRLGWEEEEHYNVVDMSLNEQAADLVREMGYMRAPVVQVTYPDGTNVHWGGMNPGKINQNIPNRAA